MEGLSFLANALPITTQIQQVRPGNDPGSPPTPPPPPAAPTGDALKKGTDPKREKKK
ncbi:MAG TPA: hypothetical protein VN922_21405 [Bacteroidia bacterium]|nr:hypothetical protein [Bacteroidia bacterium]